MRQIMSRASIALMACACALQVHAQTKEEIVTDVILQAADAWDKAREAKRVREEEQARQAQARAEDEARLREQQKKEDELRRKKLVAAIRNWPGLGGLTPPLEAGEAYGETGNGCGIVLPTGGSKTFPTPKYDDKGEMVTGADGKAVMVQVTPQEFLRTVVWSGDCPDGLAHGLGILVRREYLAGLIDNKWEYSHGRKLSRSLSAGYAPGARHLSYSLGDAYVIIPAWRDPFVPRFGKWTDDASSTKISVMRSSQGKSHTIINAEWVPCNQMVKHPRGCSDTKVFDVPTISVTTFLDKEHQTTRAPCPNLRDTKGCEALWQQIAGPVIAEIQPLIAQAEADDTARRKRYADLNAMFLLNARVMRMANDAEAQQNKERRLAAVAEGEAAEKKRGEAAEAEKLAKQQQAERDFKAQLTRLNAGQLYVMADEMKTAGKPAQAREALHALITRFPDHALAGNAASMLATLK
jgi:hypothetical protein